MGGSLRFFGGYSLAFYKPTYFQSVYPAYDQQFSLINAIMASVLCFISALAGGLLSDMYRVNKMSKACICIFSSLVAAPALFLCFEK